MGVQTSGFVNVWFQIKKNSDFHPLEVVGRGSDNNLKWVKIM